MKHILITGPSGNVGKEVVLELTKQGLPVKAAIRRSGENKNDSPNLHEVDFDFADPNTFSNALKDTEKVFLMRPPQISDVKRYIFPFIDAAAVSGVRHIIFLSLQGVAFNPFTPHYKIEKYIKKRKIAYTFLRPNFFMQNLSTFYKDDIKLRNEIFLPAGNGRTAFVDTRDIGAVAAKVIAEESHYGKAYTLTGPESLDYYEVAEIFTNVLGRKINYTNPTPKQYIHRLASKDLNKDFIRVQRMLYFIVRHNFSKEVTQDVSELLGKSANSLAKYVQDYKDTWL